MSNTENSTKIMQTKRVLANQLMGLLESKIFKKITVNDICEGALITEAMNKSGEMCRNAHFAGFVHFLEMPVRLSHL